MTKIKETEKNTNVWQTTTQKTHDWATRTPLRSGAEHKYIVHCWKGERQIRLT
jgi:hypothetical protein